MTAQGSQEGLHNIGRGNKEYERVNRGKTQNMPSVRNAVLLESGLDRYKEKPLSGMPRQHCGCICKKDSKVEGEAKWKRRK